MSANHCRYYCPITLHFDEAVTLTFSYTVHLLVSPAFTMTLLLSAVLRLSSFFLKTLVCSRSVTMHSLPPVSSWSMWKDSPIQATGPRGLTRQWSRPLISVYCGCRERWATVIRAKERKGRGTAEKREKEVEACCLSWLDQVSTSLHGSLNSFSLLSLPRNSHKHSHSYSHPLTRSRSFFPLLHKNTHIQYTHANKYVTPSCSSCLHCKSGCDS